MAFRQMLNAENISKVLCVVLLLVQSGILDYYLIEHNSLIWLGFAAIDIVVVALWFVALYVAFKQFRRKTSHFNTAPTGSGPDELRVAYVAWFVYSVGYTIEIILIFKNFAHQLDNTTSTVFGQNMLKFALTLTPMLFLLLVHAHHDAAPKSARKYYIERLTGGVTIDLMDSIEILEILFVDPQTLHLPTSFENSVIAFACINVFLPTLALFELKQSKFTGRKSAVVSSKMLYNLCYIFLVNVPFLVIRIVLWAEYHQDVSVFLGKNVIYIFLNSWDIYAFFTHHHHHARSSPSEDIVLQVRPSDTTQPGSLESQPVPILQQV